MYVITHILLTDNAQISEGKHALNGSCESIRQKFDPLYTFAKDTDTR